MFIEKKTTTKLIRLSDDLKDRLELSAKVERMNSSAFIRLAIEEKIARTSAD